jgi:hypothetical protein
MMRKNELIAKLQGIKGNPEIVLWNGMVSDWMPIGSLSEQVLTKYSLNGMIEACRREECQDRKEPNFQFTDQEKKELEVSYRKHHNWEFNQFVDVRNLPKSMTKKKVYMLDAKLRWVSVFDRVSGYSY